MQRGGNLRAAAAKSQTKALGNEFGLRSTTTSGRIVVGAELLLLDELVCAAFVKSDTFEALSDVGATVYHQLLVANTKAPPFNRP